MTPERKADLVRLVEQMRAAAAELRSQALRVGVDGFIYYSARVNAYVERCARELEGGFDIGVLNVPPDDPELLAQGLQERLNSTFEELAELRVVAGVQGSAEHRVQARAAAYALVEKDLQHLHLWVASLAGGSLVVPAGSLIATIDRLMAEAAAVSGRVPSPPPRPHTTTISPQRFDPPEDAMVTATLLAEDLQRRRTPDNDARGVKPENVSLRSPAEQAKLRPANYADLSAEAQWAIDKRLGILDWDGTS